MPFDDTPDIMGEQPTPPNAAEPTEQTETQETQPAETPQPLTRAELDELLAQRDALWQSRLDEAKKESQSRADRARNVALNKANAFERDYAPVLQAMGMNLTPEQVATAKQEIINREFWQPEQAPTQPQPSAQPQQVHIVSRDEIAQYVQQQGVDVSNFPIEKFAGLPSNAPGALESLQAEISAAKTRKTTPAAQVVQQFGNTGRATPTQVRAAADPLEKVYDRETLARLAMDEIFK